MTRRSTLACLLLLIATTPTAASDLAGGWLLTTVAQDDRVETPMVLLVFAEDGRLLIEDHPLGSWSFDSDGPDVVVAGPDGHPLTGTLRVETLDDHALTLSKDGDRYAFERIDTARIPEHNERSGLAGCWELESGVHASTLVRLALPDALTLVHSADGVTDTERGRWLVSPEGDRLLVLGLRGNLKGWNGFRIVDGDHIRLQTRDGDLSGRRRAPAEAQRLTFRIEDLPEDPSEDGLPAAWLALETLADGLSDVQRLDYRWGRLLPELGVIEYTSAIESEIRVDLQAPSVRFTHFSVSTDGRDQSAEAVKGRLREEDNPFFPRDLPWPYEIVGRETLEVPAGSFNCTVVVGFEDETRIKLWMIDDLPGAYARVVEEGTGMFGDPSLEIFELERIVR